MNVAGMCMFSQWLYCIPLILPNCVFKKIRNSLACTRKCLSPVVAQVKINEL
jgi:hypothetical protein